MDVMRQGEIGRLGVTFDSHMRKDSVKYTFRVIGKLLLFDDYGLRSPMPSARAIAAF